MVIMLDGTDTVFRPQVAAAMFGYLLGVACAVSSFLFGRQVVEWLRSRHPSPDARSNAEEISAEENFCEDSGAAVGGLLGPSALIVAVVGLVVAFACGDSVYGSAYYRKMWIASLLSPFGALLRWRLSELSNRQLRWTGVDWFPWGTFTANVVAAAISALVQALDFHIYDASAASFLRLSPALQGIDGGFAGSLSTVATLVWEMLSLKAPGRSNCYCLSTIVCSMLISLLVYSPIVRSG